MPTAHIDTFTADHLPPQDQWPELLFEGLSCKHWRPVRS